MHHAPLLLEHLLQDIFQLIMLKKILKYNKDCASKLTAKKINFNYCSVLRSLNSFFWLLFLIHDASF